MQIINPSHLAAWTRLTLSAGGPWGRGRCWSTAPAAPRALVPSPQDDSSPLYHAYFDLADDGEDAQVGGAAAWIVLSETAIAGSGPGQGIVLPDNLADALSSGRTYGADHVLMIGEGWRNPRETEEGPGGTLGFLIGPAAPWAWLAFTVDREQTSLMGSFSFSRQPHRGCVFTAVRLPGLAAALAAGEAGKTRR